ncbi:putative proton-coupled zinc antiporter SLC30A3 isoform X1 [Larus michahellis]|uniref:putative proton-coupled zinc antiporter SLC30A3 isoform X1 n=1 Tax=Larus michahellis TaxID=119627 RepID=UPI003D9BF8D7
MEPPSGTESARLVSPRGGRADGSLRLKSLFAGSQDIPAPPPPLAPAPHCHCSPRAPSPGPGRLQARRQLSVACTVCCLFMVGEVIGGYLAHSLAIMTDAAHLLTDVGSMSVSLFSLWVSTRPPTKTMSFGWHRSETLGALASVLSIWVVTGALVYLAAARIVSNDYEIEARAMLATSASAVGVNLIMAYILHQSPAGHGHGTGGYEPLESTRGCLPSRAPLPGSTSVRAAFIHVVGDLLQSVGVLVAATIIYFKPQCKIADPISTLFFSIFVLGSTFTILKDVFRVLMEGLQQARRVRGHGCRGLVGAQELLGAAHASWPPPSPLLCPSLVSLEPPQPLHPLQRGGASPWSHWSPGHSLGEHPPPAAPTTSPDPGGAGGVCRPP